MSTRSGKRLHNTSSEDIGQTQTEVVLKSKRKGRSKRVVEDGDGDGVVLKSNKRQNYVSFPADQEVTVNNIESETQAVPARKLRRNTLKEQNAAPEEVELANNDKKQVRQTRRTKKLSETVSEATPELPSQEEAIEVVNITNGKSKNKKSKKKSKKVLEQAESTNKENVVNDIKKKKNKRKKKSQENAEEQVEKVIEKRNNDSNMSTDSFHSAAGSPICVRSNLISLRNTSSQDVTDAPTMSLYGDDGESSKKRKSSLKNKSFETISSLKDTSDIKVDTGMTSDKGDEGDETNEKRSSRKSSLRHTTIDKDKTLTPAKLNTTFEKETTVEVITNKNKRKSRIYNRTSDTSDVPVTETCNGILNTTFEKDNVDDINTKILRMSNNKSINEVFPLNTSETINKRRSSPRKSLVVPVKAISLNGTFDISSEADQSKPKSLDTTFDKESKLDSTYDKTDTHQLKSDSKSSLISSDATESTINVTLDKSDEISKISITDDDSKIENILNTTPVLVESSMEESKLEISNVKTPETAITPMKREGTFTKDEPEVMSPKQTPSKRQTLPAAGCTPYHSNGKGSQKKKSVLNLTHSIEKGRRSSLAEVVPRATRVMFCSPVNNPVVVLQQKSKVIKSNLKGSNKSFVYEENDSLSERAARKRSFTHTEGEASTAKRSRLERPSERPAERPARARTASAMAKLSATPQKAATPAKPKSDVKATKLPNFAALHARRFERMESLDECQQRRAARARALLEPAGALAVLQRSPRVTLEPLKTVTPLKPATPLKAATLLKSATLLKPASSLKTATPFKPAAKLPALPTLDTLQRGYTRFGFKMNSDVNPFSIPSKIENKPKEIQPKVVKKVLPSLAGATSLRRAVAKQTIMREKSFTSGKIDETRKEFRTVIKGVRTNRRFELQMKSRNLNG